ncbi:MAG: hypothetical protein NTY36_18085 [Deltaproteobacteria bacterium]|nr:hypothetical protein [Deltaproteobacteria bacterium]
MDKRCTVCNHAERPEIDRQLIRGVPYRALAEQFGLSSSALRRHTKHLAGALDNQRHHQDQANLAVLLERLDILNLRLDRLFNTATDQHSLFVALGAIRESLRLVED